MTNSAVTARGRRRVSLMGWSCRLSYSRARRGGRLCSTSLAQLYNLSVSRATDSQHAGARFSSFSYKRGWPAWASDTRSRRYVY